MRGPYAVLSPISQSHPFEERKVRVGPKDDPLKVGRSVARLKPSSDNGIFDCKVLSRNHAVMWYSDGQFYLKDTKSSNGTFVNSERLPTGDDAEGKKIYSRDIIQFGVEIVESSNKVAHGCIHAMILLINADNELVESPQTNTVNSSTAAGSRITSMVTSHQLFQMKQYISEAMYREQTREKKIQELEEILESMELVMESARKAVVNEDRLLSKIEMLEAQLAVCNKSISGDKLREELHQLNEDKDKFETISKDTLRRAQEEKVEAELRLSDIDRSLVTTEEECNLLRKKLTSLEERITAMSDVCEETRNEHMQSLGQVNELETKLQETQNQLTSMTEMYETMEKEGDQLGLVRKLQEMISMESLNYADSNLEDLVLALRSKGVGAPPEPPTVPVEPSSTVDDSEVKSAPEDRIQAVQQELEGYLKENLTLQARIRELESQMESRSSSGKTSELTDVQSVSTVNRMTYNDVFCNQMLMFSLVPLLAALLALLLPIHRRFFATKKLD